MQEDLVIISVAAEMLGVSPNTVTAWAGKCQIELRTDATDGRIKLLSLGEVEQIRTALDRRNAFRRTVRPVTPPKEIERPIPPPVPVAPPELRVTDPRAMTKAQLKALTTEQKRLLAKPWPDGWHTVDALRTQYQIHPQVIENAELEGHFRIELGVWKKGNVYVHSGISAEEYPKFLTWVEAHQQKFRGRRKRPEP